MIDASLFEKIVNIRRDIHQHPELGFDVERTAALAADEVERLGFKVRRGVGKTGVVADWESPGAMRRVALRADMDALPIQEEGNLPYKSKSDGKAHLCGHDAHTAMLIGAAHLIAANPPKNHVRLIFQPSEEQLPGGAPGMIAEGCLEGVDAIYGLHVWPTVPAGTVGIKPGVMLGRPDKFDIEICGRGGHAAAPHQTIDPIYIACQLVTMMQSVVSRTTSPLDEALLTVTAIHAGEAYNVIPQKVQLKGTLRAFSEEVLGRAYLRLKEIVEKGAASLGGEGKITRYIGYPPLINDEASSKAAFEAARSFLPAEAVICPIEGGLFGEDFSFYLQKVPGCYVALGCRNEEKECIYPLHHPRFNLDEECMKVGIRLFRAFVS